MNNHFLFAPTGALTVIMCYYIYVGLQAATFWDFEHFWFFQWLLLLLVLLLLMLLFLLLFLFLFFLLLLSERTSGVSPVMIKQCHSVKFFKHLVCYRVSKKKLSFIVFRFRYVLLVKFNITRCVLKTKYHAWAIWIQEEFLYHVFWPTVMTFEQSGGTQIGLLWPQNSSYSPPGHPLKDYWCRLQRCV